MIDSRSSSSGPRRALAVNKEEEVVEFEIGDSGDEAPPKPKVEKQPEESVFDCHELFRDPWYHNRL